MLIRIMIFLIVTLVIISFSAACPGANDYNDLTGQAQRMFGSLPAVMSTEKNPVTPEKVKLGKILFFENRISIDGTVSCARCHPFSLYGADGLRKSIGNNGKISPRNAPTIFNAAAQIAAHWIGNRTGVEDQARQSVTGPAAFGMPSGEAVEQRLVKLGYTGLFKAVFRGEKNPVTMENFAKAVGCFERTLVTPAPFDAYVKGNARSLSEQQKKGLKAFIDAGCGSCHSGPYVGGQMYRKFGLAEPYWKFTKSAVIDAGRFDVTKKDEDRYVFKVPVLRNVEKTRPYFHDGSVDDLADAIRIMGKVQIGMDLGDAQVKEMVLFLKSLTGVIPEKDLIVPLLP